MRRHCRHVYGSGGIRRGQVHVRFIRVVSHECWSRRFQCSRITRLIIRSDVLQVGGILIASCLERRSVGFVSLLRSELDDERSA